MRVLPLLVSGFAAFAPVIASADSPVVLELYTSQGCSSCPPADELLAQIAQHDGVIALALHVDYWDYLGWKDSFGKAEHTARQRDYARAAKSRSVYTPEMVVQGEERVKGHDAAAIAGMIAAYQQRSPGADLTLSRDGDALDIRISPTGPPAGPSDVHVVHYVPSETVSIEGGENAGREVTYANVVTDWETVGQWDGSTPFELRHEEHGAGPVAVIVQQAHMGPVVTAGSVP